jgi:FlaA1/EpsC-like NDP-sugar epimerase
MRRKMISGTLMVIDLAIVTAIPFIALVIRFEGSVSSKYYGEVLHYLPGIILTQLVIFYLFGLYHRLWKYASIHELLAILGAATVSSVLLTGYMVAASSFLPRSVYVLSWFLIIALVGTSRLFIRTVYYWHQKQTASCGRVLIMGAGDAGAMIAREIQRRYYATKKIVGFIDDDPYKRNLSMFGIKVLGNRQDLKGVVKHYGITEIIIAFPSVDGSILREIARECKQTQCEVKTIPGIYELIDGKVTVQQLRHIDLEDLLRRDSVQLDIERMADYLTGKRVLVTGAGGSIGSELCRQIAKLSPATLILLGKGENSIYEIEQELRRKYQALELSPVIADVRDKDRIGDVFSQFRPQVVFHAAAHKHVPLMEIQPQEAVHNNIFGTQILAEAADQFKTEIFVMISTDKAVNPTSVMGATKRVAELIIQHMSSISNTKYVVVRFGNVLGSRGSVIPLFKKQIAAGGPITLTHPDMKRYFMTIPEASQLVMQAGALAQGGEVFVLDMGEPVKIMDMACDLIELSGLVPHKDIKIQCTGLRPGEKLFEELLTAEEGTQATKHTKIFVANLKQTNEAKLMKVLLQLKNKQNNSETVKLLLHGLIPTYRPYETAENGGFSPIKVAEDTGKQRDKSFYQAEAAGFVH